MSSPMTAPAILDREFLEIRAKLLELAASFDRLDRSEGTIADHPRWALIQQGLQLLQRPEPGRAEALQLLFSRDYDGNWQVELGLAVK